jgi:tRNA A37 methylthiotransferase MiaB
MEPKVMPEIIDQRAAAYRKLAREKKRSFLQSLVGSTAKVLIEDTKGGSVNSGFTEHYVKCIIEEYKGSPNCFVDVRIKEYDENHIIGDILSSK